VSTVPTFEPSAKVPQETETPSVVPQFSVEEKLHCDKVVMELEQDKSSTA